MFQYINMYINIYINIYIQGYCVLARSLDRKNYRFLKLLFFVYHAYTQYHVTHKRWTRFCEPAVYPKISIGTAFNNPRPGVKRILFYNLSWFPHLFSSYTIAIFLNKSSCFRPARTGFNLWQSPPNLAWITQFIYKIWMYRMRLV